ncbi:DUF4959 domain-containing protein [Treponema vincentii]|uniref:DUF4959 domain-containing protein n=1 Tax=Treponema vincentii TaxID=69710 RepID=UPI0020A3C25F|nr:DUF4959 domain-containing protein [Treponema vincentii]UTC49506.1 DUF4959 domain-containing protein [Treponema vincentii]
MTKHFCKGMAVFAVLTVFTVAIGCKQTVTVSEKKDTTPPAEVTELKATAGNGKVSLSWVNPADADLHQVEISATPAAGSLTNPVYLSAAKGSAGSFMAEGLTGGQEYTFTVKTIDKTLNMGKAVTVKATPQSSGGGSAADTTAPAEVTELKAVAGNGKVSLSWKNPGDADLYQVEITASPATGTLANSVYLFAEKGKAMSFTAEGLTNGTAYTFTVKTLDKALNKSTGTKTEQAIAPIDTSDKTPPAEVTELKAIAGDGKVSLSWVNPADADLYQVEISASPAAGTIANSVYLSAEKGKAMSFTAEGLTNGTAYTFTVKTIDKALNKSTGVRTAEAVKPIDTSDKTPPAEVTELKATAGDGKVSLSWVNPADADLYQVEISASPAAGTIANSVYLSAEKGKAMSFTAEGLTNGTAYTFTVKTIDKALNKSTGVRTAEAVKPIDTSDKTPPAEVTELKATAGSGKVSLSWKNPGDADLYQVEISASSAAGTLAHPVYLSAEKGKAMSFTAEGLTNGTAYTFTVKTIDKALNKSTGVSTAEAVKPVDTSDKTPPAEVTELKAVAGNGKVSLSWKNPDDADLYQVEITASPMAGTLANSVYLFAEKGKAMSFTVEGLNNGTAYTFTVKTIDKLLNKSTGVSTAEAVKPVDTSDKTPPAEVTELKAVAGSGKVSLSWKNPGDADLYQVEISASPAAGTLTNPVYLPAEKGKAMSFTAEGLSNGTAYTFTVKTLDKALNKSAGVSTAEAVKPIDTSDKTPPAEVGNLQAEALAGAIRVTWQDPADEDLWGIEITSQQDIVSRSVAPLPKNAIFVAKGQQSRKISNLTVGQSYTFTIKTIDNSGNKSAGIKTTTVTPKAGEPMSVTLMQSPAKGTKTNGDVTVNFTSNLPITEAKWKKDTVSVKDVLTNGTPISITDKSFTVSENGIYSVAVQDNDGRRDVETIKIENIDKTPPAVVKNLTVSYSAVTKKITVSWQNPADSDFAGVTLSWKKGAGSTTSVELSKTATQYKLTETAEIGEEYRVAVRAKDDLGNESDEASTSGTAGGLNFTSFTIPNADISKAGSTVTAIVQGVKFIASGVNPSNFSVSCETASITDSAAITVRDDSTLQVTFTIPGTEGTYIVTVACGAASTIGTSSVKDYTAYTVGKIVLADNTLVEASNYSAIDSNNPPVGIICGSNSYKAPQMIALHTTGILGWAKDYSTGCDTTFKGIICTPSQTGNGAAQTATFTGDSDGSDNWEYIKSIDPAGAANAAMNYPAFHWVEQYNTRYAAQLGGTNFAWYMPSIAELCEVYKNRAVINESLAKIREQNSGYADSSLGTSSYWSSSQKSNDNDYAWLVDFGDGYVAGSYKSNAYRVCCLAGF